MVNYIFQFILVGQRPMKHLNIKIFGVVQGVNFRWSAKQEAESLSIAGFVRNTPNGTVYIEAEGDEEALKKFLEWVREGPNHAKVERVKISEGEIENFESFEIKY